jgi:hypothetical protein
VSAHAERKKLTFEQTEGVEPLPTQFKVGEMSPLLRSMRRELPLYPRKRRKSGHSRNDAKGHVWTAPGWQGESSRRRSGRCSHVFGLLVRFT